MSSNRITGIVKVDSKGRITIPQTMRENLGIEPGMLVALLADGDKKEIVINPILSENAKVLELNVDMIDKPGSLAKVIDKLAEYKIDIISNRCTSITRREEGECTFIIDTSQSSIDVDKLKSVLESIDVVTQVRIKQFEVPTY
ncbi:looped-hinge helix DNA binding domain, AbrB family [Caldisphaera lagunensis DSM 15908]|uniref:Looped-hinge helix DNA binding domain, AbrB family n=1 Tax=Caldisphaera lagunensis (strain DSM 15908 / JCM 11604 / ANMR 0165 / IC-154) TaxID=1056495 RepID=L0ACC7_CALLD|nr:AbrB/MazE/SpoVT family DNA-binding domain-containing protein [Caldisphaera lagunensis]AFZ71079.1 looped-hinge helix DNA binding domain, AbrB family [Caldisphaera lagunensis DSM 15908]